MALNGGGGLALIFALRKGPVMGVSEQHIIIVGGGMLVIIEIGLNYIGMTMLPWR